MATRVCHLNEIADKSGRGFELGGKSIVIVRMGNQLSAFENVCPHIGTPLNWMPDQFMDFDKRYIQCGTHGALFEPDTGLCIAGPCTGCYLTPVEIEVIEGQVFLR